MSALMRTSFACIQRLEIYGGYQSLRILSISLSTDPQSTSHLATVIAILRSTLSMPQATYPPLVGLSGRLNPPTRFMYCLYSVFFSFLTPYTLFPGTFVCFVVLNPTNPIAILIAFVSSSSSGVSTSILSALAGLDLLEVLFFEFPFAAGLSTSIFSSSFLRRVAFVGGVWSLGPEGGG